MLLKGFQKCSILGMDRFQFSNVVEIPDFLILLKLKD